MTAQEPEHKRESLPLPITNMHKSRRPQVLAYIRANYLIETDRQMGGSLLLGTEQIKNLRRKAGLIRTKNQTRRLLGKPEVEGED